MSARMKNPAMVLPGVMKAIGGIYEAMRASEVPQETLELIHLRASQINGCAACIDIGTRNLKKPARPMSGSGHCRHGERRRITPRPSGPRWR